MWPCWAWSRIIEYLSPPASRKLDSMMPYILLSSSNLYSGISQSAHKTLTSTTLWFTGLFILYFIRNPETKDFFSDYKTWHQLKTLKHDEYWKNLNTLHCARQLCQCKGGIFPWDNKLFKVNISHIGWDTHKTKWLYTLKAIIYHLV